METALRVALIVALIGFVLWVARYVHENPVGREIERLTVEVERLDRANEALREQNERYRTLVRGLREDPRVLDRRARETLGMSREGEVVVLFDDDPANGPR